MNTNLSELFSLNEKVSICLSADADAPRFTCLVKKIKSNLLAVIVSNRDKDKLSKSIGADIFIFHTHDGQRWMTPTKLAQDQSFPLVILSVTGEPGPYAKPEELGITVEPEQVESVDNDHIVEPEPAAPEPADWADETPPDQFDKTGQLDVEEISDGELDEQPGNEAVIADIDRDIELLDKEFDGIPEIDTTELEAELDADIEASLEPIPVIEPAVPEEVDSGAVAAEGAGVEDELDDMEIVSEIRMDIGDLDEDMALVDEEVPPAPATGETEEIQGELIVEEPAAEPVEETAAAIEQPEPVVIEQPEPVVIEEPGPVAVEEPGPVAVEEPEPVAVEEPGPVAVDEPGPVAVDEPGPVAPERFEDFFGFHFLVIDNETAERLEGLVNKYSSAQRASMDVAADIANLDLGEGASATLQETLTHLSTRISRIENAIGRFLGGEMFQSRFSFGHLLAGGSIDPLRGAVCLSIDGPGMYAAIGDEPLPDGCCALVMVDRPWDPPLRFDAVAVLFESETLESGVSVGRFRFIAIHPDDLEAIERYCADGPKHLDRLKSILRG